MNLWTAMFGKPIPSLSAAELSEKLKKAKHPIVIDVRQPEEYRSGHIAGAKLIPLGELSRKMKHLPANSEIVCVCASAKGISTAGTGGLWSSHW